MYLTVSMYLFSFVNTFIQNTNNYSFELILITCNFFLYFACGFILFKTFATKTDSTESDDKVKYTLL